MTFPGDGCHALATEADVCSVMRRKSKSGYYGVTWSESAGKWRATMTVGSKQRYLGLFVDAEDAARAYDTAAIEAAAASARRRSPRLNFPLPPRHADASTKAIPLPGGRWAIVDASDYEALAVHAWSESHGYVSRVDERGHYVTMHSQILGPGTEHIDHADRNPLNNKRSNLRRAVRWQNNANKGKQRGEFSSKYKGVHWHAQHRKWCAVISREGRKLHLGLFRSEPDAARAYNRAAAEVHGEFAVLNEVSP